jgi:hypothetical protein
MAFVNIKERADKIKGTLKVSERHTSMIEDNTYHGEAERVLCEGIRSKFTSEELRQKSYCHVSTFLENFKKIKNALVALSETPDSKDQYDIVVAAQEEIIKEYDRLEAVGGVKTV